MPDSDIRDWLKSFASFNLGEKKVQSERWKIKLDLQLTNNSIRSKSLDGIIKL